MSRVIESPVWFRMVACIVAFRFRNGKKEVLLTQREDERWAIPGGIGAFPLSTDLKDFACREFEFDTGIQITDPYYLDTIVSDDLRTVVIYFAYDMGPIKKRSMRWFSLEMVRDMDNVGQIAFNNAKLLHAFWKRLLPTNLF